MPMPPPFPQTGLVENGTGGGCSSCLPNPAGFLEGGGGGGFFLPATIFAAADSPPNPPVPSCCPSAATPSLPPTICPTRSPYLSFNPPATLAPAATSAPCRCRKLLAVASAARASPADTDPGFCRNAAAVDSAARFCSVVVPCSGAAAGAAEGGRIREKEECKLSSAVGVVLLLGLPIPKPGTEMPAAPRRVMAPWEGSGGVATALRGGRRGGRAGGPPPPGGLEVYAGGGVNVVVGLGRGLLREGREGGGAAVLVPDREGGGGGGSAVMRRTGGGPKEEGSWREERGRAVCEVDESFWKGGGLVVMDGLGRGWGECTLLVRPIMLFCGFVVRYLELGTVAGGGSVPLGL